MNAEPHSLPTDDPTVMIPRDGCYRLGNESLQLELRVDLAVSNIVSGDLTAVSDGHSEYVASLRSRPGLALSSTTNPLPIVAEDVDGRRTEGLLTIIATDINQIILSLTVASKMKALPISQPLTFVGRFIRSAMRELGIEMEWEADCELAPQWMIDGRTITIEGSLEDAGFDIFNVGHRTPIPTPPGELWDDAQLHGLMTSFAQEPLDRPAWHTHVLMLQKPKLVGLNGIMFDSGDADLNQLPRQGVAVFQYEIKYPILDQFGTRPATPRPDWQRKLIQTVIHEIGHALNLRHRFERSLGRADSRSFMNYDWRFLGGGNVEKFWREFLFTFDPDELAFLRHGPRMSVMPGGAEFGTIPYWENTDGGYSPYRVEVPTNELSLQLVPPTTGPLFDFGQPVLLTVQLINNTNRDLRLYDRFLDPKTGFLNFVVQRKSGPAFDGAQRSFVFNPVVHRCFSLDLATGVLVPPGGKLVNNVNLTFGSSGFTFIEPGNYEVTAVLSLPMKIASREFTVVSNKLSLRIGYPKTADEEREGLNLFRADVGLYLALGGSDALPKAEETLDDIVERRQKRRKEVRDPLVVNIVRSKAINQSRDFISYRDGVFSVRRANPEAANQLLTQIESALPRVFDPQTAASTRRLTQAVQNEMREK